jgi:hypothetical protein
MTNSLPDGLYDRLLTDDLVLELGTMPMAAARNRCRQAGLRAESRCALCRVTVLGAGAGVVEQCSQDCSRQGHRNGRGARADGSGGDVNGS